MSSKNLGNLGTTSQGSFEAQENVEAEVGNQKSRGNE
jgi:hypothetical protein